MNRYNVFYNSQQVNQFSECEIRDDMHQNNSTIGKVKEAVPKKKKSTLFQTLSSLSAMAPHVAIILSRISPLTLL